VLHWSGVHLAIIGRAPGLRREQPRELSFGYGPPIAASSYFRSARIDTSDVTSAVRTILTICGVLSRMADRLLLVSRFGRFCIRGLPCMWLVPDRVAREAARTVERVRTAR
jgi:hypothetical protein